MKKGKEVFDVDYKGYYGKAWYLEEPKPDAVCEISKDGEIIQTLTCPAYKVFNVAAHFSDIVESLIVKDELGHDYAMSDGLGGNAPMSIKSTE